MKFIRRFYNFGQYCIFSIQSNDNALFKITNFILMDNSNNNVRSVLTCDSKVSGQDVYRKRTI